MLAVRVAEPHSAQSQQRIAEDRRCEAQALLTAANSSKRSHTARKASKWAYALADLGRIRLVAFFAVSAFLARRSVGACFCPPEMALGA